MKYESDNFDLCELSWPEVAGDIKQKNKELYNAIASSLPAKKCTFIKASYPYGAQIVENGVLHLPHKSGISVPITSHKIDPKWVKKLAYAKIPLAFLTNKASELHINRNERSIPLELLYPGDLFGVFETVDLLSGIDTQPIWSVSSGARNLFMLPKISNDSAYKKLSRTLVRTLHPPQSLTEHWQIFKSICNHKDYTHHWRNDILFFTDGWFEKHLKNLNSSNFYRYIFKKSVIKRHYTHTNLEFDLSWNNLTVSIADQKLYSKFYLLNVIKHLFSIAKGMSPGFKVADTTDVVAPIKLLQDVFTNFYGLKKYLPTLMHPHSLRENIKKSPLYYALSLPLTTEGTLLYKTMTEDIIHNMRSLKWISNFLKEERAINNTHLFDKIFSNEIQYDYFHSETDQQEKIHPISQLPIHDPSFLQDKLRFPDREFCTTSPFFNGCISIQEK